MELHKCSPAHKREIDSALSEMAKGWNVGVMVEEDNPDTLTGIPEGYVLVNLNVSWLKRSE